MIKIEVLHQKLNITYTKIVSDTINYLTILANFSNDWDSTEKYIHFTNKKDPSISFQKLFVDDRITREDGLDLTEGEWIISIHGETHTDGITTMRITTENKVIKVEKSGIIDGEPFPEITPSIGEQVIATANNALEIANDSKNESEAAKVLAVNAEENALNAVETSQSALDIANDAKQRAQTASAIAGEAINAANSAVNIAVSAQQKSSSAVAKSESSIVTANEAKILANQAINTANNSETTSNIALNRINSAINNTEQALENIDNLTNKIDYAFESGQLKGEKGEKGDPFSIAKVYSSINEMENGFTTDGVKIGGFVLINTNDVEDPDNAKIFVKGELKYQYLTDMSGSRGITGPQGVQGIQGIQGIPGVNGRDGSDANVTETNIKRALGFTPADANNVATKEDLSELAAKVVEYKTLTISVKDTEGNPVVGNGTVVVSDGNGNTYATIAYSGNAVIQRLPIGFSYSITVNDDIDGYYKPDTINGVVTGDAAIVVTIHKIGVISSFADIQDLVQYGIANKVFSIGDQIHVDYTYNGTVYDCPFDVVAFENVTKRDGSVVPGMYLQQHFTTIESFPINLSERTVATEATAQDKWYYYGFTSSTVQPVLLNLKAGDAIDYSAYPKIYKSSIRDTTGDIVKYGYNNYVKSIYREWLNSDAEAGQWHTAQYPSQPTPSDVNRRRGYVAGLDPEFVAIVGETEQKVELNGITDGGAIVNFYDKFFLPSLEQLYYEPHAAGVEGSYWPYWKNTLELNAPSNGYNEKRKIMALDKPTVAYPYLLRSVAQYSLSSAWLFNGGASLAPSSADKAIRCTPACVIC